MSPRSAIPMGCLLVAICASSVASCALFGNPACDDELLARFKESAIAEATWPSILYTAGTSGMQVAEPEWVMSSRGREGCLATQRGKLNGTRVDFVTYFINVDEGKISFDSGDTQFATLIYYLKDGDRLP